MPFDEMSPEYQQRLEEHIRQQNIQQNMESAWENSPEVFSDVYMLYVNMRINNIDLKVSKTELHRRQPCLSSGHGSWSQAWCCRSLWILEPSAAS